MTTNSEDHVTKTLSFNVRLCRADLKPHMLRVQPLVLTLSPI